LTKMTNLWRALEQWPGAAAARCDWLKELGDEWSGAEAFLRKSGRRATELACPKSSENGCSRQIVKLIDGRLRAECGDIPNRCDYAILERPDISVLELNRAHLASALAEVFHLVDAPDTIGRAPVQYLGRYEISAGRGFPAFLVLPTPGFPIDLAKLDEIATASAPKVVFTPTRSSLDQNARSFLGLKQATQIALEDIVLAGGNGKLTPARPIDSLFSTLIEAIVPAGHNVPTGPGIVVPSGTNWAAITIEFVELAIIRLTVAGTSHRLGPDDLELKNATTQRPKAAWSFLKAMAQQRGRINRRRTNATDQSRISKQKEAASKALRNLTGMSEDPIKVEGDDYVASYVTHADDLRQGKQDQR